MRFGFPGKKRASRLGESEREAVSLKIESGIGSALDFFSSVVQHTTGYAFISCDKLGSKFDE
jgi:hypothetical protein